MDELAIHKEVGIPRGRLCPEAMKYLDRNSKALMFAASGTNPLQVHKYISYGASPNTYDQNRTSPLHIACRSGCLEVVKELISQRSCIDITDCAGWTSLHIASHYCHPEIVEFLLTCQADAVIVNLQGETAFDLAHDPKTQKKFLKYWGSQEVVRNEGSLKSPRPLTPYSEESSILSDHWVRIGNISQTFNLLGLEDVVRKVFNNNYKKGLAMMQVGGFTSQVPVEVAMYLYSTPRLSPVKIGEILGDPQEYMKEIAKEFIGFLQIEPYNMLASLKKLLRLIKMPKGLMADQVLDIFAERFYSVQGPFSSKDSAHHLAFSIISLDNYLNIEHEPISKEEFISRNRGLHDGGDFPEQYLSWIYDSLKIEGINGVFHEQTEPIFEEVEFSGFLRYKFTKDWKEKYFILSHNALWCYKSTTQATPYACIPLWNNMIHANMNYFSLTGTVVYLRFSEDGKVNMQKYSEGLFKMDNSEMWVRGLQSLITN